MTFEIATVLGLLVLAIVLFVREKLRMDLVTLLILAVLGATRILTPAELFAGFGSELLVTLGAIFVLGGALQRVGILELLVDGLLRVARGGPKRLTALLMGSAGVLSAFINNTTVAAIFVAPASSLARRAGISSSKILMPLAFAAIMGGTCTLIGTSTNLAVSGYLARTGMEPIGFFELAPVGLAVMAVGTLFMLTVGRRLLPDVLESSAGEAGDRRSYLVELVVEAGAAVVGARWDSEVYGLRLVEIVRRGEEIDSACEVAVAAGDTLVLEGAVEELHRLCAAEGLRFKSTARRGRPAEEERGVDGQSVAEAIILPGSELCGGTLQEAKFRQRYGLTVLAVNRAGHHIVKDLAHTRLKEGDLLLLFGPAKRMETLRSPVSRLRRLESALGALERPLAKRLQGLLTGVIFGAAILCAVTGLLPVAVSFLGAAVLAILCGCISIEKAYESIDWKLLILVGGMMAFGTAMEKTGAAGLLAEGMVSAFRPLGVIGVLTGFFVLTILLTQPMSNAAAALVVLPIALSAAEAFDSEPRTFGIAVMLAASISFITPFEPACVLVYGPGRYRFRDFLLVGGLLTVLLSVVILVLIPLVWDL